MFKTLSAVLWYCNFNVVEPILQVVPPVPIGGNITQEEGDSFSINCTADGLPLPHIVWLLNGTLIDTDLRQRFSIETHINESSRAHVPYAITSLLTVSNLRLRDSGDYLCRADPPLVGQSDLAEEPIRLAITESMTNAWMLCKIKFSCISCIRLFSIITEPVNFCLGMPCLNNGTCVNMRSGFLCNCTDKWQGTHCEEGMKILMHTHLISCNYDETVIWLLLV